MKKFIIYTTVLLFINLTAACQYVFQKTFSNSYSDTYYDIEKINNGDIYLCGKTYFNSNQEDDFFVLKSDSVGQIIWSKTYGTIWDDVAVTISKLQDNSMLIAGATKTFGQEHWDNYIVRINQDGEVIWTNNFGGDMFDLPYAKPVQDTNGDIFILGTTESFGTGGKDICLTKMNLAGTILWSKYYGSGSGNNDWGFDIDKLPNGDFIITSKVDDSSFGGKGCLIQVNTDGEVVWTKSFNNDNDCRVFKSDINYEGDILSVGRIINPEESEYDALIMKFIDGEPVWSKRFGGFDLDYATTANFDASGNHLIAGITYSDGFGQSDVFFLCLDSEGTLDWGKLFGSSFNDVSNAGVGLEITNTGYYLSSGSFSFGNGNEDFYLIKTDLSGVSSCNEMDFSPEIEDLPLQYYNPVIISGNIINLISTTVNSIQPEDELLCGDTITTLTELIIPESSKTFVHPNPADNYITIWFGQEIGSGTLTIINATGTKLTETIINNQNWIKLNVSDFEPGIYFINIRYFESTQLEKIKFIKK